MKHGDAKSLTRSAGSARAVSIIRPKAFFASRADMVFMAESRSVQCVHLGPNGSFWQALLFNLHDAACRNCRNGAGFKIQFREECRFDPGHPHHHSVLPLKVETTRSGRARCAVSHRDGPKLWRLAVSLPRRRIIHLRWTSQSSHPAHGAGSACGSPENAYSYWLSRQSKL